MNDLELAYHERMDEKYPRGYMVAWCRLYRECEKIQNGHKIPLIECKKAFDRSQPDHVEWQRIKYQPDETKYMDRWAWVDEYRSEHDCTISTAMAAHKYKFGW